jgi:hypothetical protein
VRPYDRLVAVMVAAVVVMVAVVVIVVIPVIVVVVIAVIAVIAVITVVAVVLVVVVVVSAGDQLELRRGQLRQLLKRHGMGSSSSQPTPGVRRLDGGRSPRAFDR